MKRFLDTVRVRRDLVDVNKFLDVNAAGPVDMFDFVDTDCPERGGSR